MLRIKKEIDLKELEKFGFVYNELYKCYERITDLKLYTFTTRVFTDNPHFKHKQLRGESSVSYDIVFDSDKRLEIFNEDIMSVGYVEKVEE